VSTNIKFPQYKFILEAHSMSLCNLISICSSFIWCTMQIHYDSISTPSSLKKYFSRRAVILCLTRHDNVPIELLSFLLGYQVRSQYSDNTATFVCKLLIIWTFFLHGHRIYNCICVCDKLINILLFCPQSQDPPFEYTKRVLSET
jgi:hypothetical protein